MKTKVVQHVPRINLSYLKFQIFKFLKNFKFSNFQKISNFLWFPAFVWLSDIFFPETKIIDAALVPRNNITLAWFHRKWSGVWDKKTVLSRSTRPPVVLALQRICHCDACQRSWRITLRVHLLCTPHQFEKKSKKVAG